jgi:5'-nucleotidase
MWISERVNITRTFEEDMEIATHNKKYLDQVNAMLDENVCFSEVPLDCRFSRVRTEETVLGNLMADLMRTECEADLALSNGGCMRANCIFDEGLLQMRFLQLVQPMEDTVERIKMKGSLFIEAMENGVSMYPKYEGRWPCTSGLHFKFDPELPPGERILRDSITNIDGTPFDMDKDYVVAVKGFMKSGKDGYTVMTDPSIEHLPPMIGDHDPIIQQIFINFFRSFRRTNW